MSQKSGSYFPGVRQLHHWQGLLLLHHVAREGGVQVARQGVLQGEVLIETVSKINNVKINGIIINEVASLKEGDRVQVGEEVLVWQREGGKQKEEISEGTPWGRKIVQKMYTTCCV